MPPRDFQIAEHSPAGQVAPAAGQVDLLQLLQVLQILHLLLRQQMGLKVVEILRHLGLPNLEFVDPEGFQNSQSKMQVSEVPVADPDPGAGDHLWR